MLVLNVVVLMFLSAVVASAVTAMLYKKDVKYLNKQLDALFTERTQLIKMIMAYRQGGQPQQSHYDQWTNRDNLNN